MERAFFAGQVFHLFFRSKEEVAKVYCYQPAEGRPACFATKDRCEKDRSAAEVGGSCEQR
jgi:hypothetical protein